MSKLDRRFVESFDARYAGCLATWSTRAMPVITRRHPCGDVVYHWIARSAKLSSEKQFVYEQRFNSCLYHDVNSFHVFERTDSGDVIWHLLDTVMRGKWLQSNPIRQEVTRERARAILGHSDLQV